MLSRISILALSGAAAMTASCSDASSGESTTCSRPRPAFSLTVRAADGSPVPRQTRIRVVAGSGEETYDAQSPGVPQIAYCDLEGLPDGGADPDGGAPADPTGIHCNLWTDGAAEVTVTAKGFRRADRSFQARRDACGIATTEVRMDLERETADGGS